MSIGPKHWNVLLVDDEPDVLNVSKLAMQDFTVYGLPVRINTAASMADALTFLNESGRGHLQAVALMVDASSMAVSRSSS